MSKEIVSFCIDDIHIGYCDFIDHKTINCINVDHDKKGRISQFQYYDEEENCFQCNVVYDNQTNSKAIDRKNKQIEKIRPNVRHVSVPKIYPNIIDHEIINTLYIFPIDSKCKWKMVDIIEKPNNSFRLIPLRIKACINILETFYEIFLYIYLMNQGSLFDLDSLYIDIDSGNIEIRSVELFSDCVNSTDNHDKFQIFASLHPCYFPPEWYINPSNLYEKSCNQKLFISGLRHMIAVFLFRILFIDDPFDGSATLDKYPYFSSKAISDMYGSNPIFILHTSSKNPNSSFVGENAFELWNHKSFLSEASLLKHKFCQTFVNFINQPEKRYSIPDWLFLFRTIKDQLCLVNGKWKLVTESDYWDVGDYFRLNICGYGIPLLTNKTICRYHLYNTEYYDKDIDSKICLISKDGYLINKSRDIIWSYFSNEEKKVKPGQAMPLIETEIVFHDPRIDKDIIGNIELLKRE